MMSKTIDMELTRREMAFQIVFDAIRLFFLCVNLFIPLDRKQTIWNDIWMGEVDDANVLSCTFRDVVVVPTVNAYTIKVWGKWGPGGS